MILFIYSSLKHVKPNSLCVSALSHAVIVLLFCTIICVIGVMQCEPELSAFFDTDYVRAMLSYKQQKGLHPRAHGYSCYLIRLSEAFG